MHFAWLEGKGVGAETEVTGFDMMRSQRSACEVRAIGFFGCAWLMKFTMLCCWMLSPRSEGARKEIAVPRTLIQFVVLQRVWFPFDPSEFFNTICDIGSACRKADKQRHDSIDSPERLLSSLG